MCAAAMTGKEKRTKRHVVALSFLLLIVMAVAASWGQVDLFALKGQGWTLFWDFRLPRIVFAAVNGAILALAGVLYQIALRNPMADGFTTGAASSAAFGGCLALVLWGKLLLVALSAMLFAGAGICVVRKVSAKTGDGASITMILAGISLSVIAGAGISCLKYFFEESVSTMVFWLMGGLFGASYLKISILMFLLVFSLLFLWGIRKKLALLFLDDLSAQASGVDVKKMRECLFVITTVLVAVSVSFCGVIGFLGLMIPHAVRAMIGHTIHIQLLCAPLLGAISLVMFDLFSRVALPYGGELPVGIVTSLAGGTFFFILLIRKGSRVWGN